MNTSKANTNKPWMSDEYDMPVLENEEMWASRVIDEAARELLTKIDEDENGKQKSKC